MQDPDQLIDGIERDLADTVRNAQVMQAEMAAVTARVSDDGVSVEVNHMGNLTHLDLTNSAREEPALAARILRLVAEAQAKLPDAMRAGVPSAQGTATLDAIVDQTRAMFPEPEPDEYVRGGGPVRSDDEPDDDFYSRGGLFR
ncbi:YbaB/EbfC family nucleoid-associated protein [Actinokineospora sp. G85]|uniref:YbaB/EbfC family nucleoid-associated protein n=1 Tax=Actinokineospora sp. G85 TaxID=3406626 RepID=UPI003C72F236